MEQQFANPFVQVFKAQVRTPSRPDGCEWTVVHRKGAVVIAPMTAEGKFVLVHQERVPIHETIWEFPAGQIDESATHDEKIIRDTALRELREETGYELSPGAGLAPLGLYFPSSGFTDEHCHLFLARPVVPGRQGPTHDTNEAITGCREFSAEELRGMIASSEIRDANTLSTYARLCAMGIL
ncbi:MAG: NUDIX hydrolase [Chthoniobacteraceae bacterium]